GRLGPGLRRPPASRPSQAGPAGGQVFAHRSPPRRCRTGDERSLAGIGVAGPPAAEAVDGVTIRPPVEEKRGLRSAPRSGPQLSPGLARRLGTKQPPLRGSNLRQTAITAGQRVHGFARGAAGASRGKRATAPAGGEPGKGSPSDGKRATAPAGGERGPSAG